MQAYAVFAGGGVKGAALAGGLAAAQAKGVEFVGYGGTSAGSIVALLAAVGYTGDELGRILVDKDFSEFLDDGGTQLTRLMAAARLAISSSGLTRLRSACRLWQFTRTHDAKLGLYTGDRLTEFLDKHIRDKIQDLGVNGCEKIATKEIITFDDLNTLRRPLLRVVASNVSTQAPVVLPRDADGYGNSIVAAVRASAGYPIAFQPVVVGNNRLVDGGLASNLPVFLFAEEAQNTRLPTFAFDLESEGDNAATAAGPGLFRFAGQVFNTGLEASDILLRDGVEDLVHLRIKIPRNINTLDFDISEDDRKRLFETGFTQTTEQLADYEPIHFAHTPGVQLHSRLIAQYGEPEVYLAVLRALVHEVATHSTATDLRAHVMLLTGQRLDTGGSTRMVVYQVGMNGDADQELVLADDAGCSGFAWKSRLPKLADLVQAAPNPAAWRMTPEQQARIPKNRRSMISVPIPGRSGDLGNDSPNTENDGPYDSPPIGTLSIDSSTPLADTSWVDAANRSVNHDLVEAINAWAYVIARLLP